MSRRIVLSCCSVYILIATVTLTSALPLSSRSAPHSLEGSAGNSGKATVTNGPGAPLASVGGGVVRENSWHMGQIVFRNSENKDAEVAPLNELHQVGSVINTHRDTGRRLAAVTSAFTNDDSLFNHSGGSRRRPGHRRDYVSTNYTGRDYSNGIVANQLSAYTNGDPSSGNTNGDPSSGNVNIQKETEPSSGNPNVLPQPHNLLGVSGGSNGNRTGRVSKEKQQANNENYAVSKRRYKHTWAVLCTGWGCQGTILNLVTFYKSLCKLFGDTFKHSIHEKYPDPFFSPNRKSV